MADEDSCIICKRQVSPLQHAITCDACEGWIHRTCQTAISLEDYRTAVRDGLELNFVCSPCLEADQRDDMINDDIMDIQDVPLPDALQELGEDLMPDDEIDYTFDLPDRQPPGTIMEPLEDSFDAHGNPGSDSLLEDHPEVTYEILEKGTIRGKPLLVSSDGYTYAIKRTNKSSTLWTCSVRSKRIACHATVSEKDQSFVRGPQTHVHPPDPKKRFKAKVTMKAKLTAIENVFQPAMDIVEARIQSEIPEEQRFLAPSRNNLKRVLNLSRATWCHPPTD